MTSSFQRFSLLLAGISAAFLTMTITAKAHATPDVTITCESYGYRPASCATGIQNDRVQLIQQLSTGRGRCDFNRSWTYDATNIYVKDGCRATFLVESRVFNMGCDSSSYQANRCSIPGQVIRVDMVQQQSHGRGRCDFNRSWGYDANGIWVNGGCRAIFRVERNLP
jgi:hypothetical protein